MGNTVSESVNELLSGFIIISVIAGMFVFGYMCGQKDCSDTHSIPIPQQNIYDISDISDISHIPLGPQTNTTIPPPPIVPKTRKNYDDPSCPSVEY